MLDHLFLLTCRPEEHLVELRSLEEFSTVIDSLSQFLKAISCTEHDHKLAHEKNFKPRKVVIITTSGAGGELMVAKAMEKHLRQLSYEVSLLDTHLLFKTERDIVYQFSGGMYSEDIYGNIFQKENNADLADTLWWKCDLLRRFILDDSARLLKDEVRKRAPDCILSTRYFYPGDVSLAYDLNIPLRFVHCDYRFSPELMPLAQLVNSQLVKFWIPTEECIPDNLKLNDRIQILGYPIRSGIKKMTNPHDLSFLRDKLGIKPHEKVLLMMMGRQGMGKVLLPLIQKLNSSDQSSAPLHVVIICGNNSSMKEEISNYLKSATKNEQVTFLIHGLIDEALISDYYNLGDALIGKAGGATTAEMIHMKIFGLMCKSYELEVPNLQHLVNIGLGMELNVDSFVEQIKVVLKLNKKAIYLKAVDWQTNLGQLVAQIC